MQARRELTRKLEEVNAHMDQQVCVMEVSYWEEESFVTKRNLAVIDSNPITITLYITSIQLATSHRNLALVIYQVLPPSLPPSFPVHFCL